ncbi:MAG TPA: DUF1572 family protein [Opitutaceae bacterium]|nr:DUF1572 family protein [Opitutaceae bacterium]
MKTEDYREVVLREFRGIKKLADGALAQLDEKAFFAVPGEGDNSVAVIVKHVTGNLFSRWQDFLTSDGEKPNRRRDDEFLVLGDDSRAHLMARWEAGWRTLFEAIEPLRPGDFAHFVTIRGEKLSVLIAVNRQLTHYAYHVGQIVYVAKHLRGSAWKTLSIPVGKSEEFNRAPAKYVEPT